ncbi:MAG: polysaccharide biosynthesis protein [Nitrospinae bacterium]|nr:polysaccharide biosynthesis protein [Nitrospinota bacterium]
MKFPFLGFQLRPGRIALFAFDIVAGCLSLYLAFYLRFEGVIPPNILASFFSLVPLILISRAAAYFYFGFYTRFWRYSSLEDLIQILKAVVTGTLLILFTSFLYNRSLLIPRSVIIIDMTLLIMILGGSRLAWRMVRERFLQPSTVNEGHRLPVLILGAGDTGANLLRYIQRFAPQYKVCGFLDDDSKKLNNSLSGVKVLGDRQSIPDLAKGLEIKEILIATNTISTESLGDIIDICTRCGVKYKITASITDLSTKEVHISKIKNIGIQDLLGRDQVSLDLASLKKLMQGKRVLVTGAGGSIGSELCRQILEYNPSTLVMVDRCENYLYELGAGLPGHLDTRLSFIFSSITNREKLEATFSKHQPQLVLHAAAHKHVPLMEDNPDEAVINNVIGTRIVAETSEKYAVEKFVLVSTDKVVRPSSVMGMTKRVAEKFIQHIGRNSKTRFMIVRFGNVLGSNGSVVPLFKKQISEGRVVTVTHPEMERYFMLIPEAAQLIMQAAAIGEGGNIFLLEMGEPVKIVDLARKMIQLAGYVPDQDIEIKFTGVRPGEKLKEELINPDETAMPTFHKKIKILKTKAPEIPDFESRLDALYGIAKNGNHDETIKTLWSLGAMDEQETDTMNSNSWDLKKSSIPT